MRRNITSTQSALALMLALSIVIQGGQFAYASPGDIFEMAAPVAGAEQPKAAEIHDGDVSVSSQTGALTFSYPITVPPGRNNMRPSIALNYSSQSPIYGGVAAGWSLSIPIITQDTLQGRMVDAFNKGKTYKSSLAGDRPLVFTPESLGSGVAATYRAQNDSSFARYQRMSSGLAKWRVITTDGLTHYFGETDSHTSSCGTLISDGYAPLTRTVDLFGNAVEYFYALGVTGECRVSSITWGQNSHGQSSFASVTFNYSAASQCFAGSVVTGYVGSQMSYRTGVKIVTGASQLDSLTIQAGSAHTRVITLAYDAAEALCTGSHAGYRALKSIQESAWGTDSPRVDLPAQLFTYGATNLMTTYLGETSWSAPWAPLHSLETTYGQLRNTLGWGIHLDDGSWPTVEATLMDMDGDGLPDRVVNTPGVDAYGNTQCKVTWQHNNGDMTFGGTQTIALPTLKWDSATFYVGGTHPEQVDHSGTPKERCALNYQLTHYMNGQQRTNAVANSSGCANQGTAGTCNGGVVCSNNSADCTPETSSANYTVLSYRWFDIDGDGLTDLIASPAVGGYGLYDLQWGRGVTSSGVPQELLPDGTNLFFGMDVPHCPSPSYVANAAGGRYTMCGGMFPWFIYHNHGNGVFDAKPNTIAYQPIPLDPDNGASSVLSNVVSARQGNIDIDGDGFPDAVSSSAIGFSVYRNDHQGILKPALSTTAFDWPAPSTDTLNSTDCQANMSCQPMIASAGLFDANGDGLLDQWDKTASGANVEYNDGASFRTSGGVGELSMSIRPGTDVYTMLTESHLVGSGLPHGGTLWVTKGYRADSQRVIDLDLDGRMDVVRVATPPTSPALTTFNQGSLFYGTDTAAGDSEALKHWIVVSDTNGAPTWELRADMIDLDGDGIPEGVNGGSGDAAVLKWSHITTTTPPRLLTHVDNGRGQQTDVLYSRMHGPTVVQSPSTNKVMPHSQWVVSQLTTTESIPVSVQSVTKFKYFNPRFLPDDRGGYSFRGFEEVDTTLPSNAVKVDTYGYDVDWSGRLTKSVMKPVESATPVSSIDTTTWEARGLFCTGPKCLITTYHATQAEHITCKLGQTEATCDAAHGAPYTRTTTTWSACTTTMSSGSCDVSSSLSSSSLLWVATRSLLQSGTAAADGDRRTSTSYMIWSDANVYRVRPISMIKEIQATTWKLAAKSATTWNTAPIGQEYSVATDDLVWFADVPSCTTAVDGCGITHREYDMNTGNLKKNVKPVQNSAGGSAATFDYDAKQLFVATEHTELGGYYNLSQTINYTYEYGTGTKLETQGPNIAPCAGPPPYTSPTCPAGSTYMQDSKIRIDGLGRTINRWETWSTPAANQYFLFERERNTYVDAAPASVTTESAIDFNDSTFVVRFAKTKVDLDGHGRTVKKTAYALGSAAFDQVSTFSYDYQGNLALVSLADPTVNTTATVTYTYGFDSIGRATSIRRPDNAALANQSGTNITYDGASTTTTEVAGTSGGQVATTTVTKDSFGRLATVVEKTGTSSTATTTYAYDANDNVSSVTDPMSVQTSMTHDFAGRRTSYTRGGKTWSFSYDKNGNQVAETFPGSTLMVPDPKYVNTTTYDDMGHPTGTSIGQRTMSDADVDTFGSSYERYYWELGSTNVGRLAYVEARGITSGIVMASQFLHDLAGNAGYQIQSSFPGLPSVSRNTLHYVNLENSPTTTYYNDYPAPSRATWSNINYDNRGFPTSVTLSLSPTTTTRTVATQTRNVAGLVTSRHTDTTTGTMTFVESNWTYDALGRVASQLVQEGPGNVQVAKQQLAYYGADEPKTLDQYLGTNHKHFTYGFDFRHQLTTVGETLQPNAFTATYAYNAAGRFTAANETAVALANSDVRARNVNYQYVGSDPQQITSLTNVTGGATAWAFAYDATGNETMRCSGPITSGSCTGSDETDYVYDGKDRLRRAIRKLSGVVQSSEEYWYDGNNKRNIVVKKNGAGAKTETIWFMNDVEAHYDASNNWVRSYAYITMGTPVARVDTDTSQIGKIEYQFHGLGNSTLASVDESSGTINTSFTYAPFGEVVEATNAGGASAGVGTHPRRFNDKYTDAASGLHYYGARYYDPLTMTWTQPDQHYAKLPDRALTEPRRASLYTFSQNNPLRYVDPDGDDPVQTYLVSVSDYVDHTDMRLKDYREENTAQAVVKAFNTASVKLDRLLSAATKGKMLSKISPSPKPISGKFAHSAIALVNMGSSSSRKDAADKGFSNLVTALNKSDGQHDLARAEQGGDKIVVALDRILQKIKDERKSTDNEKDMKDIQNFIDNLVAHEICHNAGCDDNHIDNDLMNQYAPTLGESLNQKESQSEIDKIADKVHTMF
ncbi:MAG: RHS repeat-associated core domain-containing protein [Kofleriaceae bacterium]